MTLEERIEKLERRNHCLQVVIFLVVCVTTALVAMGAVLSSGTIRADKIITGSRGVYFEAPDGGVVARIVGSRAGGGFEIFGPNLESSVAVGHNATFGGQIIIRGDDGAPAILLTRDDSGGVMRMFTLRSERRATLETLSNGGAVLRAWDGSKGTEQVDAQWP